MFLTGAGKLSMLYLLAFKVGRRHLLAVPIPYSIHTDSISIVNNQLPFNYNDLKLKVSVGVQIYPLSLSTAYILAH